MIDGDQIKVDKNSIDWIEAVFKERYGECIYLESDVGYIALKVVNDEKKILFNTLISSFYTNSSYYNTSVLAYTEWCSDSDSITGSISNILPAPGVSVMPPKVIEKIEDGIIIKYDIPGLTYWMLSRIEEVGRKDLDEHGRFPAISSHAFKYGYLERPIVDEWLYILGQVIQQVWTTIKIKSHRYQTMLSHDVDMPSRYGYSSLTNYILRFSADIMINKRYKAAFYSPIIKIKGKQILHSVDPMNNFDWIMDNSEEKSIKSSFYFICGKTDKYKDAEYKINDPSIRLLFNKIHKRGHEIGLHPSYNTYRDEKSFIAEADHLLRVCEEEKIKQDYWGGRMHYLRWSHPTTMRYWEAAGMTYDSTLSYADSAGFRCGTCYEYPAFDPVVKKRLNLRIRPLVAMESSVIEYMGLGISDNAKNKFLSLKNKCKSVNGCFTLLWHNSYLLREEEKKLYKIILDIQ